MSRLEQACYPYVESFYGIDFERINIGQRNKIESGSGRYIGVVSSEVSGDFEFRVRDISAPDRYLIARTIYPKTIFFNLRTAESSNGASRHPDLFAARFVDFTFYNFEKMGKEINTWRAGWEPSSVNYKKYRELRRNGLSVEDAAAGTWTGRMAAKHGFVFDNASPWFKDSQQRIMVEFKR